MTDKKEAPAKKKFTADWLVSGVLTKLGDTFDKFTGRGWKPSSSLATSELIERLKKLLDSEVKQTDGKGRFVPHNIKLKMQWDKFSTDSEDGLRKLENELLAAAIDHINDNLYHTYAPIKVVVKPDYFTEGVKLLASFDEFGADEREVELKVTVPQMKVGDLIPAEAEEARSREPEPETEDFVAEFTAAGKQKSIELKFTKGARLSVGRTKENNLSVDDPSVSKHHATLMVNPQGKFLVADTGSTNGTFINGERIAYGRAFEVGENDRVKFGNIEVFFRQVPKPTNFVTEEEEGEIETTVNESANPPFAGHESGPSETEEGGGGAGKTDSYETGSYEIETSSPIRNREESPTVEKGGGRTENPTAAAGAAEKADEVLNNGRHESEFENGQTEQRIKINFKDDQ